MSRYLLYDILDVSREADAGTIKRAYRRLARAHHPDRNPDDPDAEERFRCVRAAFEVLSDPERRRRYDRLGFTGLDGVDASDFEKAPKPGDDEHSNVGDVFSDVLEGEDPFDTSHFDDVGPFDAEGTSNSGSSSDEVEQTVGEDVVREVEVEFLEAIRGEEIEAEIDGELVRLPLEPGTADGDRLRVPNEGQPAPADDGEPGDLLLDIRVADHPDIRRDGSDLYVDLPVTVDEAILGGSVRWPTPVGEVNLEVPAGIDSGTKLRLAGRGVESDGERGDLYAVVQIRTPDVVDEEVEEAAERIGKAYSQGPREDLD